jgi:hypothetical protein
MTKDCQNKSTQQALNVGFLNCISKVNIVSLSDQIFSMVVLIVVLELIGDFFMFKILSIIGSMPVIKRFHCITIQFLGNSFSMNTIIDNNYSCQSLEPKGCTHHPQPKL